MKRVLLLACAMIALIAIGLVVGCSDDDDDGNPIITGDPNNPAYLFFDDYASEMGTMPAQFALGSVLFIFDYLGDERKASAGEPDFQVDAYNYADGWHVVDFTMRIIDTFDVAQVETLIIFGTDSLQAWVGGDTVQSPANQPDSVKVRCRFDVAMQNSDGEYGVAQVAQRFTLGKLDDPAPGDDWRIDGVGYDTVTTYFIDDSTNLCNLSATIATAYNGLAINEFMLSSDGCPSSGSMVNTLEIELVCSNPDSELAALDVDGVWTVLESFNNGMVTRTVTYGNTVWTQTEACD